MIAIFGGTYDPVHHGHLRVAWDASFALGCRVRLVPCHTPPHRAPPVADPQQRAEMLKLALVGQDRLELDTIEVVRGGVSYTVDTLRALRAEYGAIEPIVALVGADAFATLPTWRGWHELFELAHIGVISRPGHDRALDPEFREFVAAREADDAAPLRRVPHGKLLRIAVTPLGISSSALREGVAAGREPRWLVPDAVQRYIAAFELYGAP
ncbi:MAG TPA: nicotinate-nucleotide adenylyltransferase [Candidatus Saccharimonadia bacterium]|nr:nicotinate-nucleotide adenylyltransferase [Candidatus Saccharimonadia bacterium]